MTDLFAPKSKKEQVLEFIKAKHYARTSEIIKFGSSIFYNRADRSARDLATEGRIKRISEEEKNFRFQASREDIYEFIA